MRGATWPLLFIPLLIGCSRPGQTRSETTTPGGPEPAAAAAPTAPAAASRPGPAPDPGSQPPGRPLEARSDCDDVRSFLPTPDQSEVVVGCYAWSHPRSDRVAIVELSSNREQTEAWLRKGRRWVKAGLVERWPQEGPDLYPGCRELALSEAQLVGGDEPELLISVTCGNSGHDRNGHHRYVHTNLSLCGFDGQDPKPRCWWTTPLGGQSVHSDLDGARAEVREYRRSVTIDGAGRIVFEGELERVESPPPGPHDAASLVAFDQFRRFRGPLGRTAEP